jgi:hypothetical protein
MGIKEFWSQRPDSVGLQETLSEFFEGLVPLLLFAWIVAIFVLPNFESRDQSQLANYANDANIRAVHMAGDNLRYYMKRQEFETVPYPDRPALMKEIAAAWCSKSSYWFLPSVYLYDIRSGEKLDSYNCFVGVMKNEVVRQK